LIESISRGNDYYLVNVDFPLYCVAQEEVSAAYRDQRGWLRRCVFSIARSGIFSSDRTILQLRFTKTTFAFFHLFVLVLKVCQGDLERGARASPGSCQRLCSRAVKPGPRPRRSQGFFFVFETKKKLTFFCLCCYRRSWAYLLRRFIFLWCVWNRAKPPVHPNTAAPPSQSKSDSTPPLFTRATRTLNKEKGVLGASNVFSFKRLGDELNSFKKK
jgi:hypothetical protein